MYTYKLMPICESYIPWYGPLNLEVSMGNELSVRIEQILTIGFFPKVTGMEKLGGKVFSLRDIYLVL